MGSLELYVSSDNSYMKSRGDDSGLWIGTRFSSDRQLSQLSGWVRPKLKMYNSSLDAVRDFRSFITKAMADPTLAVQVLSPAVAHLSDSLFPDPVCSQDQLKSTVMRVSRVVPRPVTGIPRDQELLDNDAAGGDLKAFSRKILVTANDMARVSNGVGESLAGNSAFGEGVVYIPPDLLLTQSQSTSIGFSTVSSSQPTQESAQVHASNSNSFDLKCLIDKMKQSVNGVGEGVISGSSGKWNTAASARGSRGDSESRRPLSAALGGASLTKQLARHTEFPGMEVPSSARGFVSADKHKSTQQPFTGHPFPRPGRGLAAGTSITGDGKTACSWTLAAGSGCSQGSTSSTSAQAFSRALSRATGRDRPVGRLEHDSRDSFQSTMGMNCCDVCV